MRGRAVTAMKGDHPLEFSFRKAKDTRNAGQIIGFGGIDLAI